MTEAVKQTTDKPAPAPVQKPQPSVRISRLKTALLYVLIGGLAAAAITSIAALLIGQFNSAVLKALGTIFIFFSHALLILALLWADRDNHVGKKLLPTSILVLVFSNLISSTLGTWEIISNEAAWRAFGLYVLVIGAVFIIAGVLRLRVAQQATQIALYTSIGLVVATVVTLIPWVLQVVSQFDPLYFRIVAALSILSVTVLLIALILRGIALGHAPELKSTTPAKQDLPGGMVAIYVTIGTFAAFVWFYGSMAFIASGVSSSHSQQSSPEPNRYS